MALWEEMPTVKLYKTNLLKGMMREDVLRHFENHWNSFLKNHISNVRKLIKFFHVVEDAHNSKTAIYRDTVSEQLSKWMVDDRNLVSHCWSGNLQINQRRRLECSTGGGLELETV